MRKPTQYIAIHLTNHLTLIISNRRLATATEVRLSCVGSPSAAVDSSQFRDLVRCFVGKTPLRPGLLISLTYRCEPITLKVYTTVLLLFTMLSINGLP
jgi:hypothetical protein